jgi:RNA-binding protein
LKAFSVLSRRVLENLQRLGRVLHVTRSRNAVVRTEMPPKIGEKVVDEKLKQVGTVFDVFGPVSKPYVAVKPSTEDPKTLVNQNLYVVAHAKNHEERRRRRN